MPPRPAFRRTWLLFPLAAGLAWATLHDHRWYDVFPVGAPPKARVEVVTDTYFGTRVDDPYRWLEDLESPATKTWMRRQARYADRQLRALPERKALLAQLEGPMGEYPRVSNIGVRGDRVFYLRRGPGERYGSVMVREGFAGAERTVVDSHHGQLEIAAWTTSPDGRYVSYVTGLAELRVADVATGKDTGTRIPRIYDGAGAWLPDGRGLLYTQYRKQKDGNDRDFWYDGRRVMLHRLGRPATEDVPVLDHTVDPSIAGGRAMNWRVMTYPADGVALGGMDTEILNEMAWWVTPLDALEAGHPQWRPLVRMADGVTQVVVHDGMLYALSVRDVDRHRVLRTPIAAPDLANATVVVPESEAVVTSLVAAADALYVQRRTLDCLCVVRVDYRTFEQRPVPMPFPGAAILDRLDPARAGVSFIVYSWNREPEHFLYDPARSALVATSLAEPIGLALDDIAYEYMLATSHDGTRVPLVIIHRKGQVRDGRAPTIIEAYGAYGMDESSPRLAKHLLPWLERGGVYVRAGVRGGGEFGEGWHRAGMKTTKANSWKDAIAVAEHVIAQGWTAPAHLAIAGASSGGLVAGNAAIERPDLFRAALIGVGETNALRSEQTGSGKPNLLEKGSVAVEAEFRALLATDAYHKVRPGTAYPAMLIDTGIHDEKIDPWMPAKFAARVQAATSSGRPVLLRIDYAAGHKTDTAELRAEQYAFLLAQLRDGAQDGAQAVREQSRGGERQPRASR